MSEPTERTPQPLWPYCLAALSTGACVAEVAYHLATRPAQFSQFTSGSIVWRGTSKTEDYILLVALMAAFVAMWSLLLFLDRRLLQKCGGAAANELRELVAYANLPSVLWLAGQALAASPTRDLVWLSAALTLTTLGVMAFAAARGPHQGNVDHAGGAVLLTALLGALSPLIVAFAANRWSVLTLERFEWQGSPAPLWMAIAGGLAALSGGLWAYSRRVTRRGLFSCLLLAQLFLPLGFMAVIPTPWANGERVTFGFQTSAVFIFALALAAVAYADIFRRIRRRRDPDAPLFDAVSPLALTAALAFIKLGPSPVGTLNPDDYHFGETLLPWWSLAMHHAVPFWDYVPARGLVNYFDGAIASTIFDGTAAAAVSAAPLVSALLLVVGVAGLTTVIGPLPAVASFLLMPIGYGPNQIDIVNTAVLCVWWAMYRRSRPVAWLISWLLLGLFAFLWGPAQGGALVLATSPLAASCAIAAWRQRDGTLAWLAGVMAGLLALLVFAPLGLMVVGAVRYGSENSAVGAAAHAIEWAAGSATPTPISRWLFELIRTSWIGVGLAALAGLVFLSVQKDRQRLYRFSVVGLPIAILSVVFIYRAAGRIDPGSVSRLGYASVWMDTLLLPVLLSAFWQSRRWPAIMTVTLAAGALLMPAFGSIDLQALGRRAFDAVPEPIGVDVAQRAGFNNVGRATLPAAQVARLVSVRKVLDATLGPDETYLDLTNRNAQYFYLNQAPPIESGALYNLPSDSQQLRAVERLRERPAPVVLASGDAEVFDGGPQSYRAYAIYRYLALRYVPVKMEGLIFLMAPDRLARLREHPEIAIDTSNPTAIMHEAFGSEVLHSLPRSWGASWRSLEPSAILVRRIESAPVLDVINAKVSSSPETFSVDRPGDGVAASWALAPPIKGTAAGLLTFDFSCQDPAQVVVLEVFWRGPDPSSPPARVLLASGPRVVVPLDASPQWLLATAGSLRIGIVNTTGCPEFSIRNIELWQRRIAETIDRP